jgi:hypothetical protein
MKPCGFGHADRTLEIRYDRSASDERPDVTELAPRAQVDSCGG